MKPGARGSFGAQLKALREVAGFTQEELATIAGLSVHAGSALERGERRRPHVETVRAMSAALDLTGPTRDALPASARAAAPGMAVGQLGVCCRNTIVARPWRYRASWLSFIGHTTDSLWSVDLFRCESIVLRSYWVLVVMDQFTRRLVGVAVHCGAVDGANLCRMFNAAIQGRGAPRHLSTDHDPLFTAHRWMANLRILEIDEIKTVPHVPLSHPFVERLIGTMRREFLDQMLFWNARDLERKLADFQAYYNAARSHASLRGHTPLTFVGGHTMTRAELNHVRWVSHCRDLVQLPVAA